MRTSLFLVTVFILLDSNKIGGQLDGKKLTEEFPELSQFSMDGNSLSGTIPTELGNLPNLQQLIFSRNDLVGTIPSALANGAPLCK